MAATIPCDKRVIICDIEGTTTSISFVKETLFPYAEKHLETYLTAEWDSNEDVKGAVKLLREQYDADKEAKVDGCVEIVPDTADKEKQIESLVANVKWQMSNDRKAGALKTLQGLIWEGGFKSGAFKGHVYDDVSPAFEAWSKADRKMYIYSSGSAAIQRVLFANSEAGDLSAFLVDYFDTKVGAKQEQASYEAIAKQIEQKAADCLFLTDIPAEARAAKGAGMEAILVKRPGNAELTEEESKEFTVIESFAVIEMPSIVAASETAATKRKCDEDVKAISPPAKVPKIADEVKEKQVEEKVEKEPEASKPAESGEDKVVVETVVEKAKETAMEVVEEKEKKEEKPEKVVEAETEILSKSTEDSTLEADKMEVDSPNGKTDVAEEKKVNGNLEKETVEKVVTEEKPIEEVAVKETATEEKKPEKTEVDAVEIEKTEGETVPDSVTKIEESSEEPKISQPAVEAEDKVVVEDKKVVEVAAETEKPVVAVVEENGKAPEDKPDAKDTTKDEVVVEAKEVVEEKKEVEEKQNGVEPVATANGTGKVHENGKASTVEEVKEKVDEVKKTNGHDDSNKENDVASPAAVEAPVAEVITPANEIVTKKLAVDPEISAPPQTTITTSTTTTELAEVAAES